MYTYESEVKIDSPKSIADYLIKRFGKKDQEHFVVVLLSAANKIIKTHICTIGTANQTIIHAREVFREAIKRNAINIIIAHNHPSGDLTPSEHDRNVTTKLCKAGEVVGIKVVDHLIISAETFYSFSEHGEI